MNHFKGKVPLQHVIDARKKGQIASSEIHGAELAGHVSAAADAAKETAILLMLLWNLHISSWMIVLAAWLVWKVGRSAILGYARLERLHRLTEEERWEIEHHREQEKEELAALYKAKGFSGKLLEEVLDVLMADDNRLLQVMLEEELGLSLESYEHPLKQAAGAALGVIGSALILSFGFWMLPWWGSYLAAGVTIALSAGTTAQLQKNRSMPAIVWNLALGFVAIGISVFFS